MTDLLFPSLPTLAYSTTRSVSKQIQERRYPGRVSSSSLYRSEARGEARRCARKASTYNLTKHPAYLPYMVVGPGARSVNAIRYGRPPEFSSLTTTTYYGSLSLESRLLCARVLRLATPILTALPKMDVLAEPVPKIVLGWRKRMLGTRRYSRDRTY